MSGRFPLSVASKILQRVANQSLFLDAFVASHASSYDNNKQTNNQQRIVKRSMPDFSMESLLGPKLLTKVGGALKPTDELMKDKDLVLLYFSASWCPPCKAFSPILINFYNACAKEGKLEIVYVSSDRTVPEFEAYYEKMPWLSIPTEEGSAAIKNNLTQQLGLQGIPTLVVVDAKTGEFISAKGREDVTQVGGGDNLAGQELIAKWKNMERRPFSEGAKAMGQQNPVMAILMWFVKNPMAIFAILYFYKYLKRRFNPPDALDTEDEAAATEPPVGAEESEF